MKYKHEMEMKQIKNQIDKMESLVSRIGKLGIETELGKEK